MTKRRHMWTDQEKEQFIIAAQSVPKGKMSEWLRSQGRPGTWFYDMRKAYLAAHPELNLSTPNSPAPANQSKPILFAEASEEEKRRLLAEYDALPTERWGRHRPPGWKSPQRLWREAHGDINTGTLVHYRKHFSNSKALVLRQPPAHLNGSRPVGRPRKIPIITLPHSAPSTLTVDDLIAAFKVERDFLNEHIAKMERMRDSHK